MGKNTFYNQSDLKGILVTILFLFGLILFIIESVVMLSETVLVTKDLFNRLTLAARVKQNGIKTEAVFWEIETEEGWGCRDRKSYTKCHYRYHHKARYLTDTLYEIELDKAGSTYPFLEVLPLGQRLLISYLPDDPLAFDFAYQHDKNDMLAHLKRLRELPLWGSPLIQADPITLSTDGERGYAPVHISYEMLNYRWLDHKSIKTEVSASGVSEQEQCDVFVGLSDSPFLGSAYNKGNLRPDGVENQDSLAIVNLVNAGDILKVLLKCPIKGKQVSGEIEVFFNLVLEINRMVRLGVEQVEAVNLVITR